MPEADLPEQGLLQCVFIAGCACDDFVDNKGFLEDFTLLEFFHPALAFCDIAAEKILRRKDLHQRFVFAFRQLYVFLQRLQWPMQLALERLFTVALVFEDNILQ